MSRQAWLAVFTLGVIVGARLVYELLGLAGDVLDREASRTAPPAPVSPIRRAGER
jgi:hypothetical protein